MFRCPPASWDSNLDVLTNVVLGFSVALAPANLLFCFLGSLVGTLVGVLPGLGPVGAVAFLLSLTFKMEPASAIIMLAGIYYGAMYGGSTTSILVNIPGETASVVTCLDGYRMARQGRAGRGAGHLRVRLVYRRHGGRHWLDVSGAAARSRGAELWPAGIFRTRAQQLPRDAERLVRARLLGTAARCQSRRARRSSRDPGRARTVRIALVSQIVQSYYSCSRSTARSP